MTTSPKHIAAQKELATILSKYYKTVTTEFEVPVPNPERYYDSSAQPIKEYKLDVYACEPVVNDITTHWQIGIEIDGATGHKKTRHQFLRDEARTKSLETYYGVKIFRFDTDDIVGRGQRKKGTVHFKPLVKEIDICQEIGITLTLPKNYVPKKGIPIEKRA